MKLISLILGLFFLSYPIFSQSSSKGKWSSNFGIMNWHEAKKKCESVKMQLPTIGELKMKLPTIKQFESGLKAREFENQAEGSYWLSEMEKLPSEVKQPYAYYIHWTGNHSLSAEPSENYNVRCVK